MPYFLIPLLLLLASCGSQTSIVKGDNFVSQPAAMTIEEARAASGLNEEYIALYERLNYVCKLPSERLYGLGEDDIECVVSRMVLAFGAEAGERECRSQLEQGTFINCIVDGTFLTLVARNAGSADIPPKLFWADQLQAWERLNRVLNDGAAKRCDTVSQHIKAACRDNYVLQLFEIDGSAVSACPIGWGREDCLSGAATAKLIRKKLPYIL